MVGVAQLVRALVCGTSCRGFESHHPPIVCESGGIGRRAGFRYQYHWCGSSSLPSRKEGFMMNTRNCFILICFILVSCSSQINNKTLIYNDKYVCISEEKEACSNTMFEKCGKSYDLIKEEYYTYFFKPNRYIITFKCN